MQLYHHQLEHDRTQLQTARTTLPLGASPSSTSTTKSKSGWATGVPWPILDTCFLGYGGYTAGGMVSLMSSVCSAWHKGVANRSSQWWRQAYARDFWLSHRPLPATNANATHSLVIPWPPGSSSSTTTSSFSSSSTHNDKNDDDDETETKAPAKKKAKAAPSKKAATPAAADPAFVGSSDEAYYLQVVTFLVFSEESVCSSLGGGGLLVFEIVMSLGTW
jgi:hypothetical protein